MNFPVGSVVGKGDVPFDFASKAMELAQSSFNGYIILTVKGHFIEEGVVFFREGEIVSCIVECLALEQTLKGDKAMDFFLNATKGVGFFHCVMLTRSQIDLINAFDEKLLLSNKIDLKDLPRMIPSAFSPKFYKVSTERSALEAYGLGELM